MREILFRGKSKHNGEWAEGNLFAQDDVVTILPTPTNIGTGFGGSWWIDDGFYPVAPETVGQYTGLTDIGGNRIFEGDIMKTAVTGLTPHKGVVEFADGAFGLRCTDGAAYFLCFVAGSFTIIGNVHDTPELTKEAAQ